jgi:predicted Rossmann fold nucleotide-binding protein DprA/Smf involved in DNA uptake
VSVVATHDSQAISLLCAPIAFGETKPLTPAEWARLATAIHESDWRGPGQLVGLSARDLGAGLAIDPPTAERVASLLDRGGTLALELERLDSRGIWLVTRADDEYPEALKKRLGLKAPAVLFGAGRRDVTPGRGVAVVGSRDASDDALEFAEGLGRAIASEGAVVVSGAARGIDRAAMDAALDVGGLAAGVVADGLVRMTQQPDVRAALADERLTLVTPYGPEARFTPGNAMGRNRFIYCLADAAVVVATSAGRGGTWAGATENLKARWVPLWVWAAPAAPPGNHELLAVGGHALEAVPSVSALVEAVSGEVGMEPGSFETLLAALVSYLETPRSERDVKIQFGLRQPEARALLGRAVESGRASRSEGPVRYVASSAQSGAQPTLFDGS